MNEVLNQVLPNDGRELLIIPFDGRWKAQVTIYDAGEFGERKIHAVASTPDLALFQLHADLKEKNLHVP